MITMSNPTPNRAVITVFAQTQFLPNANVRIGQKTATQLAKGVFVRGYGLLGVDVSMKLTHAMTNVPAPPKKLPKLMIATTKQAFLLCVYACMHANITIVYI